MNSLLSPIRLLSFVTAVTVWLQSAAALRAQTVPALVNYQGRLSNPDGTPLAAADYQLTFKIYDSATNSSGLIWGPQVFDGVGGQGHGSKIPVVQGYFNVLLGPVDTNGISLANAFNASNRFVEITISNRPPILPRQQILSAPFAFNSAKLYGADWSAVFGTNDPVNGRIPTTKLETNGAILAQSVGIRVNNPAVPLDVLGRTRQRGDNGSASAGTWLFDTVTGTDRAFVGMNGNGVVGFLGNAGGGWGLNMNVINGYVGIGTASPSVPFHVQGPGGGTDAIFEASPGVNTVKFLSHNGGGNYGSQLQFTDGSTESAMIRSVANGGLRLATAGAERVTIDNSGKIGIGTTTPFWPLHIQAPGSSSATVAGFLQPSLASGSTVSMWLGRADAANQSGSLVYTYDAATPANSRLSLGLFGNSSALNILGNGNVGIGTANPLTSLHIPATGLEIGTSVTASDNFHLVSDTFGGTRGLRVYNGNWGAGSHLVSLTTGGNVGIGTATPQTKLEVAGNVKISSSLFFAGSSGSGANSLDPGALELGDSAANGTPTLIDFHFGTQNPGLDYNVRIINDASEQLTIYRAFTNTPMARFNSAGLRIYGAASFSSDRNMKENFAGISPVGVLDKVLSLPISQWNYRQDPGSEHIGPMAQDFFAAFQLGTDERQITAGDEGGVALAAIQGLNQKLERKLQERDVEIELLKARLSRLEGSAEIKAGRK